MKILMVCLGNICRSPLAHGIMQSIIDTNNLAWEVDSCGTGSWHAGESPDRRSIAVARNHDIDISDQRARQITNSDLEEFDLILTMDSSNYRDVISMTNNDKVKDKIHLIMNYVFEGENRAVPDPYYGNDGFENVYWMLEEACEAIIQKWK